MTPLEGPCRGRAAGQGAGAPGRALLGAPAPGKPHLPAGSCASRSLCSAACLPALIQARKGLLFYLPGLISPALFFLQSQSS